MEAQGGGTTIKRNPILHRINFWILLSIIYKLISSTNWRCTLDYKLINNHTTIDNNINVLLLSMDYDTTYPDWYTLFEWQTPCNVLFLSQEKGIIMNHQHLVPKSKSFTRMLFRKKWNNICNSFSYSFIHPSIRSFLKPLIHSFIHITTSYAFIFTCPIWAYSCVNTMHHGRHAYIQWAMNISLSC